MAEESLEIIIDDVSDFSDFKERVFNVFRVADYRGNLQARRLFEDTDLVAELEYEELQKIRKAVDILFPHETLPKRLDLNSTQNEYEEPKSGKGSLQFSKVFKDGEVLKVFFHEIDPEEDTDLAIREIYTLYDARLSKTNKRTTDFTKYLRKQSLELQNKITMILGLLYRQTEVSTVIERLKGEKLNETVESIRQDILEDDPTGELESKAFMEGKAENFHTLEEYKE